MNKLIKQQIMDSIGVKQEILADDKYIDLIQNISRVIINTYKNNGKVLICGNGGSAADSQHIAAEFVSKFKLDRKPISAIALTVNTSILTAVSNDYSYDNVFKRQVEAFGKKGDVLIGISTSGNSRNISLALEKATELGMISVALLGCDGGENKNFADLSIIVPSNDTPRIQESHIMIGHIVCDIVEKELFGKK
ncbi:D-sedoheptulose 7-phosphate isomerase [Clostridium fermenticellae]|uniref:Phosphoheptose isomerase n=1 Tax=Clostridium fermenticellae TaxID=2068654 RepID=A0A386H0X1_9CLOT|nr:D-sedoheptulose 7-phosphate isomerase [Clostridium fermenticellae]AYD39331.1 D-sedoheptulose 7-phosphate isomerase [Clostridium fermenticellae]